MINTKTYTIATCYTLKQKKNIKYKNQTQYIRVDKI